MIITAFTDFFAIGGPEHSYRYLNSENKLKFKEAIWFADIGFSDCKEKIEKGHKRFNNAQSVIGISNVKVDSLSYNIQSRTVTETYGKRHPQIHYLIKIASLYFSQREYHRHMELMMRDVLKPQMLQIVLTDYDFDRLYRQCKQFPILDEPYCFDSFRWCFVTSRLIGSAKVSYTDQHGNTIPITISFLKSSKPTPDDKRKLFHRYTIPENYILCTRDDIVGDCCFEDAAELVENDDI